MKKHLFVTWTLASFTMSLLFQEQRLSGSVISKDKSILTKNNSQLRYTPLLQEYTSLSNQSIALVLDYFLGVIPCSIQRDLFLKKKFNSVENIIALTEAAQGNNSFKFIGSYYTWMSFNKRCLLGGCGPSSPWNKARWCGWEGKQVCKQHRLRGMPSREERIYLETLGLKTLNCRYVSSSLLSLLVTILSLQPKVVPIGSEEHLEGLERSSLLRVNLANSSCSSWLEFIAHVYESVVEKDRTHTMPILQFSSLTQAYMLFGRHFLQVYERSQLRTIQVPEGYVVVLTDEVAS